MLKSLYVNNYKNLVNFKAELDKLTILIGKNGSGKTNVISLLMTMVFFIRRINDCVSAFPFFTKTRWMDSDIQTFELEVIIGKDTYLYHLEVEHSGDKAVFVNIEYLKKQGKILAYFSTTDNYVTDEESGDSKEVWRDSTGSSLHFFANTEEYDGIRTFVEYMGRILICSPNPKMMQEQVDNDHYYPNFDFSNIASVYAGILPMQPEVFEDFRNAVRESDGAFKSTQVEMDGYRKYLAVEYVFDGKTCKLHFSELSDGEKMRFAMYLLLYGFIKQGMIVLLDEPDNYMSLKEIQPWCMELEEICEEKGQCIMISHHAEVIDFLAADHGVWMSRLSSGEAVVTEDPYRDLEDAKMMPYSELMTRDIV